MSRGNHVIRRAFDVPLTHGAGADTATLDTESISGIICGIQGIPPAEVDAAATVHLNITDSDGCSQYQADLTVGDATFAANLLSGPTQFAVAGPLTLTVTYSAAQTVTDSSTKVVLLIQI